MGEQEENDNYDQQKRSRVTSRQRNDSEAGSSSLADNDENDEIDHLNFIEQMLQKNNSREKEIQ